MEFLEHTASFQGFPLIPDKSSASLPLVSFTIKPQILLGRIIIISCILEYSLVSSFSSPVFKILKYLCQSSLFTTFSFHFDLSTIALLGYKIIQNTVIDLT